MSNRQNELTKWLEQVTKASDIELQPLANDASFKQYFRLINQPTPQIALDAPPEKEPLEPMLRIDQLLQKASVQTPKIHAVNKDQGFVLFEDLGNALLLDELTEDNQNSLYNLSLETLLKLQRADKQSLPKFDKAYMLEELNLFSTWFLDKFLNKTLGVHEQTIINETFHWLTNEINTQPHVFIHRDYHSRNLMIYNEENIAVIDFQDAMSGPLTYDLASLVKDCYIKIQKDLFLYLLGLFHQLHPLASHWSFSQLIRAVDLCGLQRHLKVLGIFCRLSIRDNKPRYLKDLPLVMEYTMATLAGYDELKTFHQFMKQHVLPTFLSKVHA